MNDKKYKIAYVTDDLTMKQEFVVCAESLGCECRTGTSTLWGPEVFDIYILNWPEEFMDWANSFDEQVAAMVLDRLNFLVSIACVVGVVHNIEPHKAKKNANFLKFFESWYARCDYIIHTNKVSRRRFQKHFDSKIFKEQLVLGPFSYYRNLYISPQPIREWRGREHILIFGDVRWPKEIIPVLLASFLCISGPSVFFAGRLRLSRLWRLLVRFLIISSPRAYGVFRHFSDEEVLFLFDNCSAVMVNRPDDQVNSGVFYLALERECSVIAPINEYFCSFSGFKNITYFEYGGIRSIARAMSSHRRRLAPSMDLEVNGEGKLRFQLHRSGWEYILSEILKKI
jgi:hypothetical protein